MGKKVKVAAIQIQYPDGEVKQVSIDDARELFRQLEELFGVKTVNVPVPSSPIIIERDRWPRWNHAYRAEKPAEFVPHTPTTPQIWCVEDKKLQSETHWTNCASE